MSILVTMVHNKRVEVPITDRSTVLDVKRYVHDKIRWPPLASLRLIFQAQRLHDSQLLRIYKIYPDAIVHAIHLQSRGRREPPIERLTPRQRRCRARPARARVRLLPAQRSTVEECLGHRFSLLNIGDETKDELVKQVLTYADMDDSAMTHAMKILRRYDWTA